MNLPRGDGARHLTLAIQLARELDREDLMLSDLAEFIEEYGIGDHLPPMLFSGGDTHPDKASLARCKEIIG